MNNDFLPFDKNIDFYENIVKKRFTCRKYSDEIFPIEVLKNLAAKALMAPSADNRQAFRFYILEKKEYYKVRKLIKQDWALKAPYLVFLFSVPEEAYVRNYDNKSFDWIDSAVAFDHFILLLTEAGFGTAWTSSSLDPKALIISLKLPKTWELVAFTPVGYPLEQAPPMEQRLRRRVEEMILVEPPNISQYLK
jgi:nitroreductase